MGFSFTTLRAGLVLGLLALAGCTTVPVGSDPALNVVATRYDEAADIARRVAFNSARDIAGVYAGADGDELPAVKALGVGLQAALADESAPVDLARLVRDNPDFWRAALELHPADESLPLLFAALSVLGGDGWTAHRMLVLAEATLPLAAGVRTGYLAHSEPLATALLAPVLGLPPPGTLNTVAACERYEALVRARLQRWPGNAVLLTELIDVRVRRALFGERTLFGAPARGGIVERIDAALASSAGEIARLQAIDPLSAARFVGSAETRRAGRELTTAWAAIASRNAPAEAPVLEQSVAFFTDSGRPDLAFMIQRLVRVQRGVPTTADIARERELIGRLTTPEVAAELVRFMESDRVGGGRLDIEDSGTSAAWSGDPEIHPVLAQTIERTLAEIDFNLENATGDERLRGSLRHERGVQLSRAGAYPAALEELDRALALLGREPDVLVDKAIVLSSMGRDTEAESLFTELSAQRGGRLLSAEAHGQHLYACGDYTGALARYQEAAQGGGVEPYVAVMAELAARRAGEPDEKKLVVAALRDVPRGTWAGICLRFLDGELTDRELLEAAGRGGDYDALQKRCEAYFILAQIALADGRKADGVRWLRDCVDTGFTAFVEHRLAKRELSRLAPEPASKPPGDRAPPSFGGEVLG